jgi:uncharacterized membrane protein (DUF441 family)
MISVLIVVAGALLIGVLVPWMGQLGVNSMKNVSRIMAGGALVAVLGVVASPAISQTATTAAIDAAKKIHPAPAPIAGAGIPLLRSVLAFIG